MEITPLIPDDYEGRIKRLTCASCERVYYVTLLYYKEKHPHYCHECSIALDAFDNEEAQKQREQKIREELNAIKKEIAEQFKDTPEQAMVRRYVEKRFKGFTMGICVEDTIDNERAWRVTLSKLVRRYRPEYTYIYEFIYCVVIDEGVMETQNFKARKLVILPWRRPERVTVTLDEFKKIMDEKKQKKRPP